MEWTEIQGRECGLPRLSERIDAEEAGDVEYGQAAEAFVAYSIANGSDGRVEDAEGSLRAVIENADQKGLNYLARCAPKPIWWAVASALAEGRSVTIWCRDRSEKPFTF